MKRAGIIGGALVLLTGCHRPDNGTTAAAIDFGGRTRTYLVHPPANATVAPPLVIVLHGRYGQGRQVERETRFSPLADREGFVVVYPDGVDRSWHDRRETGPAAEQHVDDVGFISALIDKMVREQHADPKRVYVTGMSNGGIMTFRLACELSDKIAAVGPVIALMPEAESAECKPTHPMPIAIFVGMDDPLIPYNGGAVSHDRGPVLSADATRARWAEIDGCDAPDVHTRLENSHTHCAANAEVRLFSLPNAGHTWPNGTQYLPKSVVGGVSRDIDGADALWRFFARH